jgi:hydrophobe/amphiphile efflux-1 (HAE1) family protein
MSTRRGLPSWAIRRPIGTAMLASLLVILGVFFVGRLPLDLLPKIVYPQIRVSVSYAGVEPTVLEETVAKPLEAALATTENLTLLETGVSEGRVSLTLNFNYGTDIDLALQDAAKNLERARGRLPEDADAPTIFKVDPSQMPIYQVAFSSGSRDLVQLREWVERRLQPQLLATEGVAAVDVSGGLRREIRVTLDQERLRAHGIPVSGVIDALRTENQDISAGRVTGPDHEVTSKTAAKFRSVAEIRSVPLTGAGGEQVPLGAVAAVVDTSEEQRIWARLDGTPAVRIAIRKQPEANTVLVVDGIAGRLQALDESGFIPSDVQWTVTFDQSNFIRDAVASVRDAALMGALLAGVVVLIFLKSLRKTFIVGVSIPLAVLATFAMMGMAGLTLNIMSLGGLALGTGLLLDNAIVMLENIYRRRDTEGLDAETAAHEGAGEVQSAVVASTLTNLASVVPFLLVSGLAALLFNELILTISFAILVSLPLALTLVPMLAAQLAKVRFRSGMDRWRFFVAFERGFARLTEGYGRGAGWAVRRRGLLLGGSAALGLGALLLVGGLDSELLPQVDDGGVGVGFRLPPGTPPERTNEMAKDVEAMIREMPHVENVFVTAGGFLRGGEPALLAGRGSMDVLLSPTSERDMTADEWVRELRRRLDERAFPGAEIYVRPPRIRGLRTSASGSEIALTIHGDELPELQRLAAEVRRRLEGTPGLANLEAGTEEASPLLAVRIDRERASFLGVSTEEIGQTLRTALDGTIATRYAEANQEYDVRVQLPRARFDSPEALGGIAVFPAGRGAPPVALRDVARVEPTVGPTSIDRENQNRILELTGDVAPGASLSEVNDEIRARLAEMRWPDGYGLVVGGEEEALRETNRQTLTVVLLAVFLVFVVLAVQYESVINPFVIMLAVPLSLMGVVATLWVTGTPLSAPVLLGMVLLAGIVVNNSILLVEFAEEHRAAGMTLEQAAVEAGRVRLRPILMTTFTSLFGTAPLAMGLGEGSELMRPLAIAVVGGVAFSTLLTLFVVPSAYVVFHRLGDRVGSWLTGRERAHPAEAEA